MDPAPFRLDKPAGRPHTPNPSGQLVGQLAAALTPAARCEPVWYRVGGRWAACRGVTAGGPPGQPLGLVIDLDPPEPDPEPAPRPAPEPAPTPAAAPAAPPWGGAARTVAGGRMSSHV